MRKIIFYFGGVVADFAIPENLFVDFSHGMPWDRRHADADLNKARGVLEAFVRRSAPEAGIEAGPNELLAACFIWNYFNTHPEDRLHIEGDILVVDFHGDGSAMEYMAAADARLAREN